MKSIGPFEFPENPEEASHWKPITRRLPLHRGILAHARTRQEGAWAAYIFPVPGMSHADEEYLWETEGEKLPRDIAAAMFPGFAELPYAN